MVTRDDEPGQVTTFYSYKGGVGRTFLLANVAWLLARWGRRVLCLDWDLEAPGLHRYLVSDDEHGPGVLDLVLEPELDWHTLTREIPVSGDGAGTLHLLGAGREDDDYLERLQQLDWDRLYADGLGRHLETLRAQWVADYDHVLVDSRTGVTDIGGICAAQLPDVLVFLFTANYQSLHGAQRVVRRALASRATLALDRSVPKTLPVPSRFDAREEYRRGQEWLARFARELREFYSGWLPEDRSAGELLGQLRIPYLTYWSFGENLPVVEERLDDPELISYWFANVAALIDRRLHGADALISGRHAYLRALAGDSVSQSRPKIDVFISPRPDHKSIAERLYDALTSFGVKVWMHTRDLEPGSDWATQLAQARESSRLILFPIGGLGKLDLQQTMDLERASSSHKPIASVRLLGSSFVPIEPLASEPIIDFDGSIVDLARHVVSLLATLPN